MRETQPVEAPGATMYQRIRTVCPSLRARVRVVAHHEGTTAGWVGADDLVRSGNLADVVIDAAATRIERDHGARPPRHVAATRVLHDYAWSTALLMSGPWFLEARVPRLRRTDVRLYLATGTLEVIPTDELMPGEPDAALRAAVAEHLGPLLAAVGPQLRRGPRALWGMVTDDLVSGIWHLGQELGDEETAVRAATRLLPHRDEPFPGGARFRQLTGPDGATHTTRARLACCLNYTIGPGQACVTCPRTPDAERVRRLAQP